jgi:hypothetical protein
MTATKVWLPKGAWTDIFTGDEYEGPKWIEAVRWTESIPVFAKEGGFFVLDGREHTNCIDNPEMLVVQSYFGDGEYDLFEDDGDKHSCHTVFTSSAATVGDARQQTVTIRSSGDDGVAPNQRTIQLEFRNIMDGEVTVTEDGTPIDCKIEKDGFLSVIIPTQFGKQYAVIAVEKGYDKKAKLLDRVVYSLLEIEGDNLKKGNLRKQLMVTDPTEWKDLISKQDFLTQNEKRRFFEEIS